MIDNVWRDLAAFLSFLRSSRGRAGRAGAGTPGRRGGRRGGRRVAGGTREAGGCPRWAGGLDVCGERHRRCRQRGEIVKYMILTYGSQQDYDSMAGKATDRPAWSAEDVAAMGAFMESFNKDLVESGELVDTRGLTAPVHTRRVKLRSGVPVVTDGPYAETQEVLAGYWIVECESFDRATAIAARLSNCPSPGGVYDDSVADVRPIADSFAELDV